MAVSATNLMLDLSDAESVTDDADTDADTKDEPAAAAAMAVLIVDIFIVIPNIMIALCAGLVQTWHGRFVYKGGGERAMGHGCSTINNLQQ